MTLIGYARTSTRGQSDDSQVDLLGEAGCERVFQDRGVSGKLAKRPQWDACLDYLRAGDTLVVTRLSRMARSVRNLIEISAHLDERDISLVVLRQQIDTRTPAGRFMFHVLAAMDEFQADLISENTQEGLASARARGRKGGRPPAMSPAAVKQARAMYDSREHTVAEIAEILKVGRATLYRHLTKQQTSENTSSTEENDHDRSA